jgi:Spy/CpxP family protein refolding chaperone
MTTLKRVGALVIALTLGSALAFAQHGTPAQHGAKAPQTQKLKPKKMKRIFLIQKGLPHYTGMLKKRWNDPKLALTPEQKKALEKVRKETIEALKAIAPEALQLQKRIVQAARKGADAKTLENDVQKLAALKARATMIQLNCMAKTRAILSPEQMAELTKKKKQKKKKRKKD